MTVPGGVVEASGSPSNLFYSFDAAGVHWVVLSSYSDYSPSSPQYKWLQVSHAQAGRQAGRQAVTPHWIL